MIFALIVAWAHNIPRGALPETWTRYQQAIDVNNKTFRCFDGSKIIPLLQLNDEYLDCNDGSDEPGTSLNPSGKFYCENAGFQPLIIDSWSVGDGICDCCDGSDEADNSKSTCTDRCHDLANERRAAIQYLQSAYQQGLELKKDLAIKGTAGIRKMKRQIQKLKKERKELKEKKQSLMSNESAKQEEDDSMFYEEFVDEDMNTFQKVCFAIWKWTFHVPKKRYDDDHGYGSSMDYETEQQVAELDGQIYDLKQKMERSQKLLQMTDLDSALMAHYGKTYEAGPYKLEFFVEMKRDSEVVGYFETGTNETAVYDHGGYCWEGQADRKCTVTLLCSNSTRLVEVNEDTTCNYRAVFATPAACREEKLDEIENMSHSQALELLRLLTDPETLDDESDETKEL